jgi:hypothetical protein
MGFSVDPQNDVLRIKIVALLKNLLEADGVIDRRLKLRPFLIVVDADDQGVIIAAFFCYGLEKLMRDIEQTEFRIIMNSCQEYWTAQQTSS